MRKAFGLTPLLEEPPPPPPELPFDWTGDADRDRFEETFGPEASGGGGGGGRMSVAEMWKSLIPCISALGISEE